MKLSTKDPKFCERLIPVPVKADKKKLLCSYRKCGKAFTHGFMLVSNFLGTHFLQRGNNVYGPVTRPFPRPYCSGQCVEDDR